MSNDNQTPDLVAEVDLGARNPIGSFDKRVLFVIPLVWSLFQLWYASPLPFIFNLFVLNDTQARAIHLAFAVFLHQKNEFLPSIGRWR